MDEKDFIKQWYSFIEQHIDSLSRYLVDSKKVCNEYLASKTCKSEEKYNIFLLVSDLYHRENLHSDIIRFLLDPNEKHGEGNLFLSEFISMLNRKGCDISAINYKDANVVREKGRIDVLIYSDSSKRAIVIENKINNAGDMHRQLPRYYDIVSTKYHIDAIVYIPLDINKRPDKSDWDDSDKKHVEPLLRIIPAYSDASTVNIVTDWLEPLIMRIDNIDLVSTLRQYSQLIKKLNRNIMDTIILEKFYHELIKDENLKSAMSIRNMLNELPTYMTQRVFKKFENNCSPFSHVWIDNKYHNVVFEGDSRAVFGMYLKIHVYCSENGYYVEILLWEDENTHIEDFHKLVANINSLKEFELDSSDEKYYHKRIDFKEEGVLFVLLNNILSEIRDRMTTD